MTDMPPTVPGSQAPHRGVLILVLGILSIVICAPMGPFAWLMGQGDLKKINAGAMDPEGKGLTQAGMICGIIGSVFLIFWLFYAVMLVLGLGLAAAGAAANP